MVDFERLGAFWGPGAPDAGLALFRKQLFQLHRSTNSQNPYFYNAERTFGCLHLPFISPKALKLLAFREDDMLSSRLQLTFSSTFVKETIHNGH